jgi:hypothetical protein
MTGLLAAIFTSAIPLAGPWRLVLMLPLCLSIAVVYKTTRCEDLSDVPKATLALWVTIVLGMFAVGVGLWLLFSLAV